MKTVNINKKQANDFNKAFHAMYKALEFYCDESFSVDKKPTAKLVSDRGLKAAKALDKVDAFFKKVES